jgi:hypothetical protein
VVMLLAEAIHLPDPNSVSSVGWIILTLAGVLGIVKLAMDLWKDHFKTQPEPHLTYQTIAAAEKSNAELTKRLEEAVGKIEAFSSQNYKARQRMHKKVNHIANALSYLAGSLAREGRQNDSTQIRQMIDKAYEDEEV